MIASRLVAVVLAAAVQVTGQNQPIPASVSDAVGHYAVLGPERNEVLAGACFWISANEAVTNWHVMFQGRFGTIKMPDGSSHEVTTIVGVDERADLVVVRADPPFKGTPLELEITPPRPRDRVTLVGTPLLLENPVTDGLVLAVGDIGFYGRSITLDLSKDGMRRGLSGSPVVNAANKVVGVGRTGSPARAFLPLAAAIVPLRAGEGTPIRDWDGAPKTRYGISMALFIKASENIRDDAKCLALLRDAVKESPDLWSAWGELGTMYRQAGNEEEAINALTRAAQNSPIPAYALDLTDIYSRRGDLKGGMAFVRRAMSVDPDLFFYEAQKREALRHFAARKYAEALKGLAAAARAEPENLPLRAMHAQCLTYAGRPGEALGYFDALEKKWPKAEVVHYGRGVALVELSKPADAVECFKAALGINPKSSQTIRALGDAYVRLGRLADAEEQLTALRRIDPARAETLSRAISEARK